MWYLTTLYNCTFMKESKNYSVNFTSKLIKYKFKLTGPDPHGPVAGAWRDVLTGAGPLDALHLVVVSLQRGARLERPRPLVPDAYGGVERSWSDQVAARRPRYLPNCPLVAVLQQVLASPLSVCLDLKNIYLYTRNTTHEIYLKINNSFFKF